MERRWNFPILLLFIFALAACSRPKGETSSISIQVPSGRLSSKTVGTFAAMPTNRVACYGINIKGLSTPLQGNVCSPPVGQVAGFVGAGKTVDASVPKGSTIAIELYLFLQPVGKNLPCPEFKPAFTNEQLANLYLVGTSDLIAMTEDSMNVTIEALFPGEANNVALQMQMPETCKISTSTPNEPTPYAVDAGVQVLVGGNINVRARAGAMKRTVLTGNNIQVIVR